VWLLKDQHGNSVGQSFLPISMLFGPVTLMDPSINLLLNEGNENKAKDETEELLEFVRKIRPLAP